MDLTMPASVENSSQYRAAIYYMWLLSGCVTDWRESLLNGRNVNGLVVNCGLLLGTVLPSNTHPTSLVSLLLMA